MGTELLILFDLRVSAQQALVRLERPPEGGFDFAVPLEMRRDPFTAFLDMSPPPTIEPWRNVGGEWWNGVGALRLYPDLARYEVQNAWHEFLWRPSMQHELRLLCFHIASALGSDHLLYLPDDRTPWCDATDDFSAAAGTADLIERQKKRAPGSAVVMFPEKRVTGTWAYHQRGDTAFSDRAASLRRMLQNELRQGVPSYIRRGFIRATVAWLHLPQHVPGCTCGYHDTGAGNVVRMYWETNSDWWTYLRLMLYGWPPMPQHAEASLRHAAEKVAAISSRALDALDDEALGELLQGPEWPPVHEIVSDAGRVVAALQETPADWQ